MRDLEYWKNKAIPLEDISNLTGYKPIKQGNYWGSSYGLLVSDTRILIGGNLHELTKATQQEQLCTLWTRPDYYTKALGYSLQLDRNGRTLESRRLNAVTIEREHNYIDYQKNDTKEYAQEQPEVKEDTGLDQLKYFGLGWLLNK